MKMQNRKIISETLESVYLEEDLDVVIKLLNSFKLKYPNKKLSIVQEVIWDSVTYNLVSERLETDEEYKLRKEYENSCSKINVNIGNKKYNILVG